MNKLRFATPEDCPSLLAIYSPYVKNTVISFELAPPSTQDFRSRIAATLEQFPWLVGEIDGKAAGYAYASKHRARTAYQWSVDLSVYIDPAYHKRNIATALYSALRDLLTLQGYYNAFAGVTIPNEKSEGFHESFGFRPVGVYRHVGYKFNRWHDVKWYSLDIGNFQLPPMPPASIGQLRNSCKCDNILGKYASLIR
ncbi:MAG TPA: N-acetyltransferase family protein [Selenomonadales bacterium]|nr:N-acetyltransferase family protein [Selenomonadales bacterium]